VGKKREDCWLLIGWRKLEEIVNLWNNRKPLDDKMKHANIYCTIMKRWFLIGWRKLSKIFNLWNNRKPMDKKVKQANIYCSVMKRWFLIGWRKLDKILNNLWNNDGKLDAIFNLKK
jgi:hypothetical protein